MILVDTSIWIDHIRKSDQRLNSLLEYNLVAIHPFVIGELAAGNLKNRSKLLPEFRKLPQVISVSDDEVFHFIETHKLFGLGLSYIDLHLLACAQSSNDMRLWTRDKRLHQAAITLHLAFAD